MDVIVRDFADEKERALAEEFEAGWSSEQIANATINAGPGLLKRLFPENIKQLQDRADQEQTTPQQLISKAIDEYLKQPA